MKKKMKTLAFLATAFVAHAAIANESNTRQADQEAVYSLLSSSAPFLLVARASEAQPSGQTVAEQYNFLREFGDQLGTHERVIRQFLIGQLSDDALIFLFGFIETEQGCQNAKSKFESSAQSKEMELECVTLSDIGPVNYLDLYEYSSAYNLNAPRVLAGNLYDTRAAELETQQSELAAEALRNMPALDRVAQYLRNVRSIQLTGKLAEVSENVILSWDGQANKPFSDDSSQGGAYSPEDLTFLTVGDIDQSIEDFNIVAELFRSKYAHWTDAAYNTFSNWNFLRLHILDFANSSARTQYALGAFGSIAQCRERGRYINDTIPEFGSIKMNCITQSQLPISAIEVYDSALSAEDEEADGFTFKVGGPVTQDDVEELISKLREVDLEFATSMDVVETLTSGLRISEREDTSLLDVCHSFKTGDESIKDIIAAYFSTTDLAGMQSPIADFIMSLGYTGSTDNIQISSCTSDWAIGELGFYLDEDDAPQSLGNNWQRLGTISLGQLLTSGSEALRLQAQLKDANEEHYRLAREMEPDSVVGVWVFTPEVYERHLTMGNDEGVFDIDVCTYTGVEYTDAYISMIEGNFSELFSVLPLNDPIYERADWRLPTSISDDLIFETADELYMQIDRELESGANYRTCDLVIAEASTGAAIYDKLLGQRMTYESARLLERMSGFAALGAPTSKSDLVAQTLSMTGFESEQKYNLSQEIGLENPVLLDALWAQGYTDAGNVAELAQSLSDVLKRDANWDDVSELLDVVLAGQDLSIALATLGGREEERVRLAEERRIQRDADRVAALEEKSRAFPYYVSFTCEFRGNVMNLATCFVGDVNTTIMVSQDNTSEEVNYFGFSSIGQLNDFELRIDLTQRFGVLAQNASDQLSLRANLYDTLSNELVESDTATGRYSTLTIGRR